MSIIKEYSPSRLDGDLPQTHELTELSSRANSQMASRERGRGELRLYPCERFLSPISAGFLGLMMAVVLWGTAYKLSLYHPHPAPVVRTQVAKLWLESRTSFVVPLREIKGIPNDRNHFFAMAAQKLSSPVLIRIPWSADDLPPRQILTAAVPIPSRAPPSI